MQRTYDQCHRFVNNPNKTGTNEVPRWLFRKRLLKKLLWIQRRHVVQVYKVTLAAKRALVLVVYLEVPDLKNPQLKLVRTKADSVQKTGRKWNFITGKISVHNVKIKEIESKISLMNDGSVIELDLKTELASRDAKIAALKKSPANLNKSFASIK